MALSLCRAQENVLGEWWGTHFKSLQSQHRVLTNLSFLRSYLSLTSEKQRFVLPEPGMLEAHHGAPVADRCRCFMAVTWWHGITVPSSQGVKSKGKKLLKMQNATGLISCKSDQISRSDASWWWKLYQFTVSLSRSPTHILAMRRPVLKVQTMNRYDKSLQEWKGVWRPGADDHCAARISTCFNFRQSYCFCY